MNAGFLIGNRSSMIGIASFNGAKRLSSTSEDMIKFNSNNLFMFAGLSCLETF